MMRFKQVMAIARAEGLITRRLARYWIFLCLAYLVAIILFFYYAALHGFLSSYSGTVGAVTPRFLLSAIGLLYSIIFLVGTIFLAFDIRARDQRERIIEVLDSRPYSNLELVAGRFLGIFLCSWIPAALLMVIIQLLGLIMRGLALSLGEPMEIFSIFSFLFIMAVPSLSFAIAMVFFITLLVRNRLVSAIILLVLTGLSYWATMKLPADYGMLFDIIGINGPAFPSEIIRKLATPEGLMQRLSVLFAALSLLGFSAAVHPRLDRGPRLNLIAGSVIVMVFAFLLSGAVYFKNRYDMKVIETWKEIHAGASEGSIPDLKKIEGDISILPGKEMFLDLDITYAAPDNESLHKAVFSLNPGLDVKSVSDSSEKTITFIHEGGLLEITLPKVLEPGEESTIHLKAKGRPDNRFAFLETPVDRKISSLEKGKNIFLGEAPGVFEKSYIALMPGLRWLPASGPEKDRDDPRVRAADYFYVDLKVDLPKGWLAAGPGRRHRVEENNKREVFHFSPSKPVPEVAFIAAVFESRSMEVEGVTLEILMDRRHVKNLESLAETAENIREWTGERFKESAEYGLEYPYGALTLVEVPNILRSYGGGWRLDTTMAPPGMLLMREAGFPTARFDSAFRDPDKFKDKEGGMQKAKWERVKNFFINDFSGGNILSGGSRNFFLHQTSAKGPEGLALNFMTEILSCLLISETKSYFSAHLFLSNEAITSIAGNAVNSLIGNRFAGSTVINAAIDIAVSRPEVWEHALEVSLVDMDPWKDPARTVDVLTLKGNAVAQSILDTLGQDKTGRLLADIRETHEGQSYSINDMMKAAKSLGYDLEDILGDWLTSTSLPGFICEQAKIYRIPDAEDGNPRYQVLIKIRNDEPAPGFFRFRYYYTEAGGNQQIIKSDPIHMGGKSAVQFGAIVSRPPANIFLEPYLSLNREAFMLQVNAPEEGRIEKEAPIEGSEELPYSPPVEDYIVVDDLDTGFNVTEGERAGSLRVTARQKKEVPSDQGLPVGNLYTIPSVWSRITYTTSHGKYRHTFTVVEAGDGEKKAVFTADINRADEWELEVHIPFKQRIMSGRKWGTYHLTITDSNGDDHDLNFDSNAASAVSGWNLVGGLYLQEGETIVTVSNKTDGHFVVADAIRWSPAAIRHGR